MTTTSNFFVEIDNLPQCEVFEARKEHKATVFFLHVCINFNIPLYDSYATLFFSL